MTSPPKKPDRGRFDPQRKRDSGLRDSGLRRARSGTTYRPSSTRLKVPIALKFAIFIALLVVAMMAWQAYIAIRRAGDRVEREINESGILAATSVALLIDPRWLVDPGHTDDVIRLLRRYRKSPGTDKVLDIIVYNRDREAIALLGSTSASRPRPVEYGPARRAGVKITERDTGGVPVRTFQKPVLGDPRLLEREEPLPLDGDAQEPPAPLSPEPPPEDGASAPPVPVVVGYVEVFISAAEITEARESLAKELLQVLVIASLAAAGASFLLARFLTRPIRSLVSDMRQVSLGDLEHKASVDSADELGDLARSFNHMTANLQAAQEAKLAQKAMEQELSVATRIQSGLLPKETPNLRGLDLAVFYLPAKEVGGDYYDFIPIDERHLGMVVADVSGKGVPGSLVMTMTRSLLRMAAAGEPSPARTLWEVNETLAPDMNPGMFVTLLYLVLDPDAREVTFARAGHNAPLFWSERHKKLVQLPSKGIALGLDRRGSLFRKELEVKRFRLTPGDVFVAYTDGVIEGKNAQDQDFGEERLSRLVATHQRRSAQEIVDAVVEDLAEHQKGVERSDDITLLVLRAT